MSLSPSILRRLQDVLLNCGQFSTENELRATFIDSRIALWRNQLPETDNPSSRISTTIDFLHTRYNHTEENALVLFLRVLSEKLDVGDACHQQLTELAVSIENELRRGSIGQRVVGMRLMDVSGYFRNRNTECEEIRRLLADPASRIISVIGRGGIGKTAIVSKVLGELEEGKWSFTNEQITVDGIIYLSTRTKGVTLERIFLDCAEMFGGANGELLIEIWTDPKISTEDKVNRLLKFLKNGVYIVLLDNMEDTLNENREIMDVDLRSFFEITLRTFHNVCLVVTTREALVFPKELMRFDNRIVVKDGLSDEDAIAVLRDLDPNGDYGLKQADESILRHAVQKVYGVPRALELIGSFLANNPFTSLEDLVTHDEIFKREEFVEELAREYYKRLDQESRYVMEALAIFGCPVPIAAIEFVLEPFTPNIPVRNILTRLIQTHSVSFNQKTKMVSLHPIDRDYLYLTIPREFTDDDTTYTI